MDKCGGYTGARGCSGAGWFNGTKLGSGTLSGGERERVHLCLGSQSNQEEQKKINNSECSKRKELRVIVSTIIRVRVYASEGRTFRHVLKR
jgi:hypothetical protein